MLSIMLPIEAIENTLHKGSCFPITTVHLVDPLLFLKVIENSKAPTYLAVLDPEKNAV